MKILIVDDFEGYLGLLRSILTANGFSTVTASNGEEGVKMAMAELPGLILMDIQMPVMNGEDAMRILKAEPSTAHIPIFAISGYSLDSDRERFLLAGFDGFIPKPINMKVLLGIIKEVAWRQLSPAM